MLVAAPDSGLARSLRILLEDEDGYEVEVVRSAAAALARLEALGSCDLVLSDLPALDHDTHTLVEGIRRRWPGLPLFLLTTHPALARGLHTIGAGQVTLVGMPIDPDGLLAQLDTAIRATLDAR